MWARSRTSRRTKSIAATWLLCACATDAEHGPSYFGDVEPVLRAHCVECHRDQGIAPFPLATYDEAAPRAEAIALAVRERRMPPWPPESTPECAPLVGARGLAEEDIDVIERWALADAPIGARPAVLPSAPPPAGKLAHVDAVLRPAEPYLPASGVDDHRCFVVDPKLDRDRWLTAYAVREDVPGIVHHVQLWALDDAAAEDELDRLDAAAEGVGYPCPEGHVVPARYASVWAPSDPVRRHPLGTGILLRAGHRMVIQVHYVDTRAVGAPDRTEIELELEDEVEHAASMWTVSTGDIALPPGVTESIVRASAAVDVSPHLLWGVRAHMHSLGRSVRVSVRDGEEDACLLSIPRWDPEWQLMYFYEEPRLLPPGAQLEVDCAYDTRGRTAPVTYGIRAQDEMCFAFFYVSEK